MKVRSSCVTRALAAQLQKLLCSCLEPGNWGSLELGAGKTQESETRERKEGRRISVSRQGICSAVENRDYGKQQPTRGAWGKPREKESETC